MAWLIFTVALLGSGAYLGQRFFKGDRRFLVPGAMTRGHYPIESECDRCHTPMLGVKSDACMQCHEKELERADDSHPPSKFTDPRNADRLAKLDARSCVVCHVEHRPELTHAMGVTQPVDVCRDCHDDIAKQRPSHEGLAFTTCQDAGCHNFHDNRALNEDYLAAHLKPSPALMPGHVAQLTRSLSRLTKLAEPPLTAAMSDAPADVHVEPELLSQWASTAHARAGVNCTDCHRKPGKPHVWATRVPLPNCKRCHEAETEGFLGGKHGMRTAVGLSPMRPELARLPMRAEAKKRELGCTSCHAAHAFDRKRAAVEACLGCHADRHSLAYRSTKHYAAWQRERSGQAEAGSGVSCATCHLPRAADVAGGIARVQHNQNDYLRPNEKMIESVCRHCHSVEFAIDALADPEVIARGVDGRPRRHVRSMDMVREKLATVRNERAAAATAAH